MNNSISSIPLFNLSLAFIPAIIVIVIMFKWAMDFRSGLYAIGRMLLQLVLIGYFLTFIFESRNWAVVVLILAVMLFSSSWIALRTTKSKRRILLGKALMSIALGGGFTLFLISQVVLRLDPWYLPRYIIPLAGMMTGQILSGISPLIAARYQIMVMCMIFGSVGISSACFLSWVEPEFTSTKGTK